MRAGQGAPVSFEPQSNTEAVAKAPDGFEGGAMHPSVSFEPQSKTEAVAKAPEGFEGGAMHPSVLEAQSKSEAVVQLTVALSEKATFTPTVIPGAALPWPRRGRVGGYFCIYYNMVLVLFNYS